MNKRTETARSRSRWVRRPAPLVVLLAGTACTDESLRVALTAQSRADEVQQTVFDAQHDGLLTLSFRDLVHQLDGVREEGLSEDEIDLLNQAWNERDLMEFWVVQHERAKALRRIGVDTRLYGEQATIDLLLKQISLKAQRGEEAIRSAAASEAAARRVRSEPVAGSDASPGGAEGVGSPPTESAVPADEAPETPEDGGAGAPVADSTQEDPE